MAALSWEQLALRVPALTVGEENYAYTGDSFNAHSSLRLFGYPEEKVRVILYRDIFAWCPYCEKVALFLEAKRIPYRVRKVTMWCYLPEGAKKEAWFTALVPSGMLPALQLNGDKSPVITESDDILAALEADFGPLGVEMADSTVMPLRRLERELFRAWCSWLCYPAANAAAESEAATRFDRLAARVAAALAPGPFFFGSELTVADVIFVPYVERMRASLYYYKGYDLCAEHPAFKSWFCELERLPAYAGLMSDFHTHAHDLPPQMGGCFSSGSATAISCASLVDRGPWSSVPEVVGPAPAGAALEAVRRCAKHRLTIIAVNPDREPGRFDAALRAALTRLAGGGNVRAPAGAALGLRHLRDQICAPRDMSIHAARALRQALEDTAALDGDEQPPPLPTRHRRDQSAVPFAAAAAAARARPPT